MAEIFGDKKSKTPPVPPLPPVQSLSWQSPDAALDVEQQTEITQDLKLLANFVTHMPACSR